MVLFQIEAWLWRKIFQPRISSANEFTQLKGIEKFMDINLDVWVEVKKWQVFKINQWNVGICASVS